MLSIGTLPCQDAFGKHDKTHSLITRRQDLQDALNRHAPLSRRIQTRLEKQDKTHSYLTRRQDLQDAFDRHAPLSRRVRKNKTRRIHTKQDTKTYKTLSIGTLPCQDAFRKTRQDAFTLKQDAKTYKTLSIGTLLCQDAFGNHYKTHSLITRRQDLRDALDRHAPLSRRVLTRQDVQYAFCNVYV